MKLKLLILATLSVLLNGCSDDPFTEIQRIQSPAGWCDAIVWEYNENEQSRYTQVYLSFDNGKGGSGAVSFDQIGINLELKWIDSETLEVSYPGNVPFTRNASGERLQFLNRIITVKLVPIKENET
jgi:hypothetical protein